MDVGYWVQEPDVSSPDSAEYGPRWREVALELDVHWGRSTGDTANISTLLFSDQSYTEEVPNL